MWPLLMPLANPVFAMMNYFVGIIFVGALRMKSYIEIVPIFNK